MKLSLTNIIRLNSGLGLLDGFDKIVKQGETERVIKSYYKLSAGFRLAMAMNADRLQEVIAAFQKSRNGIIVELAENGGNAVPESRQSEFNQREQELLDSVHEVKLTRIGEGELDLDNNPIPISHLALLRVLLPKQPLPAEEQEES